MRFPVFSAAQNSHVLPGQQQHFRKRPLSRLIDIIRQGIIKQVDRIRTRVIQFDPVGIIFICVLDKRVVFVAAFVDNDLGWGKK